MHVCRLRMYSYMKDPIIKEQKCICNILLCEQGQGFLRPFYLSSIKENLENYQYSFHSSRTYGLWEHKSGRLLKKIRILSKYVDFFYHHMERKEICSDLCLVHETHESTSCERIKLITQKRNIWSCYQTIELLVNRYLLHI